MNEIPTHQIQPNPLQPRKAFDQAALDELANSISLHGLITPITVEKLSDDRYQLIAGERRLRAVQQLGWPTIPAYIRQINGAGDQQRAVLAIAENVQRADLNPIERALAYSELRDTFGLNLEQVASAVGMSASALPMYLNLLKLPAPVQAHYAARRLPLDNQVIRLMNALEPDTLVRYCERWSERATPAKLITLTLRRLVSDGSAAAPLPQSAKKRSSRAGAILPGDRNNSITQARQGAGGHWNAIAQLKYAGHTINPAYQPAAEAACRNCVLYEDASSVICRDCPVVDLLPRLP